MFTTRLVVGAFLMRCASLQHEGGGVQEEILVLDSDGPIFRWCRSVVAKRKVMDERIKC